eukprot:scaffold498_cov291-Prasinococcus_capsulatus_cf.AAC.4
MATPRGQVAEHLRNDFELFDLYEYLPAADGAGDAPLRCPIAALLSERDPKVGPRTGTPNLMEGWAELSACDHMTVDVFPGAALSAWPRR